MVIFFVGYALREYEIFQSKVKRIVKNLDSNTLSLQSRIKRKGRNGDGLRMRGKTIRKQIEEEWEMRSELVKTSSLHWITSNFCFAAVICGSSHCYLALAEWLTFPLCQLCMCLKRENDKTKAKLKTKRKWFSSLSSLTFFPSDV